MAPDPRRERGMVTAELAVLLPAIALLAVLGAWAVLAAAAQVRCVDAAATGARALARGESIQEVRRVTASVAPPGATVRLGAQGDLVTVEVRVTVEVPGPWGRAAPGVRLGDTAAARPEATGAAVDVPTVDGR